MEQEPTEGPFGSLQVWETIWRAAQGNTNPLARAGWSWSPSRPRWQPTRSAPGKYCHGARYERAFRSHAGTHVAGRQAGWELLEVLEDMWKVVAKPF